MAAEAYTVNGSKMHIAPAQATTPADATAYAALTWTEITLLTNIPSMGTAPRSRRSMSSAMAARAKARGRAMPAAVI
jgi:hypothetical protein